MPRPWEPEGAWAPYTDVDTEGHRFLSEQISSSTKSALRVQAYEHYVLFAQSSVKYVKSLSGERWEEYLG